MYSKKLNFRKGESSVFYYIGCFGIKIKAFVTNLEMFRPVRLKNFV